MDSQFAYLIVLSAALTFVALRNGKNSDLFTFPFLFPAVTVSFVLVEFSDFMLNAGRLYWIYSETGAVAVALTMIALCSLAGLLGYGAAAAGSPKMAVAPKMPPISSHDVRFMHRASIIVGVISFAAFAALSSLGGGFQQYIFESGAYSIVWSGLPVYLIFLVRLCYVSIVIQLWLWVRTNNKKHLRWALIFSILPIINIVFIFRRSEVIKLGVFFGYFLTNYGRLKVGRVPALIGLAGMYLVLKVFPFLRDEAGKQLGLQQLVGDALQRESYENSEIGSGLMRIYSSMQSSMYEYGSIFYNAVIQQFVPAGFVGTETKAKLLLPVINYEDTAFAAYRFYLSPMGFAQAYQQFWFFGALIFCALGYFMAKMERGRFNSRRKEILLVLMIPTAVSTVSADLSLFFPQLLIFAVMVYFCVPKGAPVRRRRKGAAPVIGRRQIAR